MTEHVKVYMSFFDFVCQEEILCEACHRPAVDIHHINGRGKGMNVISNLMALCRKCHTKCHESQISKGEAQYIHNNFLVGNRKRFVK